MPQRATRAPAPAATPEVAAVPPEPAEGAVARADLKPPGPVNDYPGPPAPRAPAPPRMNTVEPAPAQAQVSAPPAPIRSEGVGDSSSASPADSGGAHPTGPPEAREKPQAPPAAEVPEAQARVRATRPTAPRALHPASAGDLTAKLDSSEAPVRPERQTGEALPAVAAVRPQAPAREGALPGWDGRVSLEMQEESKPGRSRASDGDMTPRDPAPAAHEARPLPGRPQPATPARVGERDDTPGPAFRGSVLLDQIANGVARARQLSRLVVELRPPDLGSLEIAVESRNGRLQAHFQATHPLVNSWLAENRADLRSHLAESGLLFEQFTFSSSSGRGQGGADGDGTMDPEAGPSDSRQEGPPLLTSAQAASGLLTSRLMDKFA